jgi:hypothetical protein
MAMVIESRPASLFTVFSANAATTTESADASGSFTWPAGPYNKLISEAQTITVLFQWSVSGVVTGFGPVNYKLNVYLERMGVGEATSDLSVTFVAPVNPTPTIPQNFTVPVTIPSALAVGLYRITGTMTCKLGAMDLPTAGFIDLDFLQVFPNG